GASNRIGTEDVGPGLTFYGSSFIAGPTGELLGEMGAEEGVSCAEVDLAQIAKDRAAWGIFRDRRPEFYG
ncbi:MAG: nitrilase-related carbon-nitrogen hydrolase, partial [Pseudomonadota bacterium]